MSMRSIYYFLFIIFSTQLLLANGVKLSQMEDSLAEKLKPFVIILDREAVTFHWSTGENFAPKSVNDLSARARKQIEPFSNPNQISFSMAGPGLYVAVDPNGSRHFGGENPELHLVTLKAGTRILNLSDVAVDKMMSTLKVFQDELQCIDNSMNNKVIAEDHLTIVNLRKSATPECRQLVINALKKLNIQANLYNYTAAENLRNCRSNRFFAFSIISESAIDFTKIEFYSNDSKFVTLGNAPFAKKLFEEQNDIEPILDFLTNKIYPNSSLPKYLIDSPSVSEESYVEWKKSKIVLCGPSWSIETGS